MKRKLSFLFAVLLTMTASFAYKMAYSQSEPDDTYVAIMDQCICIDRNGVEHVFATVQVCISGGSEFCENEQCPFPPAYCL